MIAALVQPPYQLRLADGPEPDLGYLAELIRDGVVIKNLEIYPYTVVGPGQNRPPDERRIQLELSRREHNIERNPPPGVTGVMLGLRSVDVDGAAAEPLIVAFAFGIFRAVTSRNSIQFPSRILLEAEAFGAAVFAKSVTVLGPPTRAITLAMQPVVLPFFLTQLADDFAAPQDWDPVSVAQVEESVRSYFVAPATVRSDAIGPDSDFGGSEMRARAVRKILQPIRDRRFADAVKSAYDWRCAACDLQLELVEAAHIDPVEDPASTDEIRNGIALCAVHHLAYDTGLLEINEDFSITVNERRVEALSSRLRDGGLESFRAGLRKFLRMPEQGRHWPAAQYVRKRAQYFRESR